MMRISRRRNKWPITRSGVRGREKRYVAKREERPTQNQRRASSDVVTNLAPQVPKK
jgi:hypothetical protein